MGGAVFPRLLGQQIHDGLHDPFSVGVWASAVDGYRFADRGGHHRAAEGEVGQPGAAGPDVFGSPDTNRDDRRPGHSGQASSPPPTFEFRIEEGRASRDGALRSHHHHLTTVESFGGGFQRFIGTRRPFHPHPAESFEEPTDNRYVEDLFLAQATIDALGVDRPILVDSAGCGAAMKDYGHLLGTKQAERFSAQVFDIHEWLADRIDLLPTAEPLQRRVAIQDPCHLRHVQRVHEATRVVLRPYVSEIVELDDEGLCCGAGGAYSVLEPELAGLIRDRKVASITRADADVVASANPGCSMHLAAADVPTVHPMELVAEALGYITPKSYG